MLKISAERNREIEETLDAIAAESGQDLRLCYQCGKCSAGCPVHAWFDIPPNRMMHLLQLGEFETVLTSRAAQLCASCFACSMRCPKEIDVGRVIDAARNICYERGLVPVDEVEMRFHRTFLRNVRTFGRLDEMTFAALHNLVQRRPFADFDIAPDMVLKGRLRVGLPRRVKDGGEVKRIFAKTVNKP
jgi:heterodisulfide reductase subunit C